MSSIHRDFEIHAPYVLDADEIRREMEQPTTPREQQMFDRMSSEHDAEILLSIVQVAHRMSARPASFATSFYLRKIT